MTAANDSSTEPDDTRGPRAGDPQLSAEDAAAVDLLIEHGLDLSRAVAARPDMKPRLEAASRLFGRLESCTVEPPDAALTDATLARIEREERAREGRMRLEHSPEHGRVSTGSGRWPDLWAVACVALILVAVGLPLANWMQARAAQANCSSNLRGLGGGIARYVEDRKSMPFVAGLVPDFGKLGSWVGLQNNRHLHALTDNGYAEQRCLCCPNDPAGDGFAYQVPGGRALEAWRLGVRVPVVADRNPAIELTREGVPVGMCFVNSPDHEGNGQNALFTDGSVEFIRSTTMMVPQLGEMPRHLENIYLPMSDSDRRSGRPEEGLDRPSDWTRLDVFLLN